VVPVLENGNGNAFSFLTTGNTIWICFLNNRILGINFPSVGKERSGKGTWTPLDFTTESERFYLLNVFQIDLQRIIRIWYCCSSKSKYNMVFQLFNTIRKSLSCWSIYCSECLSSISFSWCFSVNWYRHNHWWTTRRKILCGTRKSIYLQWWIMLYNSSKMRWYF